MNLIKYKTAIGSKRIVIIAIKASSPSLAFPVAALHLMEAIRIINKKNLFIALDFNVSGNNFFLNNCITNIVHFAGFQINKFK